MTTTAATCPEPIALDQLIAYERGELDDATEQQVEAHFFGCDHCARRLDDLHRLQAGVVDLTRAGAISVGVTADVVARAEHDGIQIRRYHLNAGDSAPCTCAPADDYVAVYLTARIRDDETVDMDVDTLLMPTGDVQSGRREQLIVDRDNDAVIVLYAGDAIRSAPRSRWTMHLRARGSEGERVLGPYVLDHTPWSERPDAD